MARMTETKTDLFSRITDPGKFEGELAIIEKMWDISLEGFAAEVWLDETVFAFVTVHCVTQDGNPDGLFGACLWEDSQGFVHSQWYETEAEYDAALVQLEKEAAEIEDEDAEEDAEDE